MKRKLFLTLFLFVTFYCLVVLTFYIRSYSTDPESCLLRAMESHKIVMLGDFEHGAALPHKTVIWLLQRWIDDLKSGKTELRHLTLVLECDSNEILHIEKFIENGALPPPEVLSTNHLEKIEFFSDLGKIVQEIARFNRLETEKNKINFRLFGPESEKDKETVYLKMNLPDSFEYFVRKRDVLISKRIAEYSSANPDHKLLIFYGNAHLLRGLRNKDQWRVFPDKDSRDYYLIHYLEKLFGRKEVFSADQIDFGPSRNLNLKIGEFLTGKNSNSSVIFFSNPVEMWFSNLFSENRPANAIIVRRTRLVEPILFSGIPLSGNVQRCLTRLEQLKNEPGFLAKREVGDLHRILHYITGKKAESIREWLKSSINGSFLSWIEAEKTSDRANDYFKSDSEAYEKVFGKLLASFRRIKNHKPEVNESQLIRSLFCVGTMWAGSEYEKAFAREELLKESGIDSDQPGDYLIWIRKKYFQVNY